jgi:hypothetical protein
MQNGGRGQRVQIVGQKSREKVVFHHHHHRPPLHALPTTSVVDSRLVVGSLLDLCLWFRLLLLRQQQPFVAACAPPHGATIGCSGSPPPEY